jgi:large subunit ribosomal protein L3
MWRGILGKKIGMTQIFTDDGRRVGVTVVEAGPCPVLQIRTGEKDGYDAFQLGFDPKTEKSSNKPEAGHAARSGATPMRFVREFRLRGPQDDVKEGDSVTLQNWADVEEVQVTSRSKGKGFQGVVKRHGFKGLRATHGVKTHHRHPGSIGSLTPTRTMPGTKMPGHMGDRWVTQKGLKVARVDPEKNLILLRGSVPGPAGGYVILRPSQKYQPPGEGK